MNRNAIVNLISSLDNILKQYESISAFPSDMFFLESKKEVFISLKNSLFSILMNDQFLESNDLYISLHAIIFRLLSSDLFFMNSRTSSDLKDSIIHDLSDWECSFIDTPTLPKLKLALQHFNVRKEYIGLFEEDDSFKEPSELAPRAKSYISGRYEYTVLNSIVKFIKKSLTTLSPLDFEELFDLLNILDSSPFLDDLLLRINEPLSPEDKTLVTEYIEVVLKLKSIFTPSKVKNDKFVQAMWNGRISDNNFLSPISKSVPFSVFCDLLKDSSNKSDDNTIANLATHFKEHGLSDTNISHIMFHLFSKGIFVENEYEYIAELFAELDFPSNPQEFACSKHFMRFEWLTTDPNPLSLLLKKHEDIKKASSPFLPAKYYIKILDRLSSIPNISKDFIGNLQILLRTNYFSEEEKQSIQEHLDANGLNNPYQVNSQIVFNGNESEETLCLKIKQAYSSGQTIPISVAQNIFNDTLSGNLYPDSLTLRAGVQSTIYNILSSMGITDRYSIFFGDSDTSNGYFHKPPHSIWINSYLLALFVNELSLEDRSQLFETIPHECNHALQDYVTNIGNVDFLGYN